MALTADLTQITADGGVIGSPTPTYGDLKAQVLDYLDRPELASAFPVWMRLFESKLNRILRTAGGETQAILTPDPVTGGCSLPNDYQAWRSVQSGSSPTYVLEYATPDEMAQQYPYSPGGSLPALFTIEGTTLFARPITGPLILLYYRGVPGYVDDTLTNWILAPHFDVYLYGTLCEAETYLKNDERAQTWQSRAGQALNDLMDADRSARWGKSRSMSMEYTP